MKVTVENSSFPKHDLRGASARGEFSAEADPRDPLDRRGPPRTSIRTTNQPRRPTLRPSRGTRKFPPDCLQVPSLRKTASWHNVWSGGATFASDLMTTFVEAIGREPENRSFVSGTIFPALVRSLRQGLSHAFVRSAPAGRPHPLETCHFARRLVGWCDLCVRPSQLRSYRAVPSSRPRHRAVPTTPMGSTGSRQTSQDSGRHSWQQKSTWVSPGPQLGLLSIDQPSETRPLQH